MNFITRPQNETVKCLKSSLRALYRTDLALTQMTKDQGKHNDSEALDIEVLKSSAYIGPVKSVQGPIS